MSCYLTCHMCNGDRRSFGENRERCPYFHNQPTHYLNLNRMLGSRSVSFGQCSRTATSRRVHCRAAGPNGRPCRAAAAPRGAAAADAAPTAARGAAVEAPTAARGAAAASGALLAAAVVWFSGPAPVWALPEQQLETIRQQIVEDFSARQYYVTGALTKSLYDPDCRFKDPTTDVKGVEPYTRAVAALFDPDVSKADLISSSTSGPNSITLRWRLEGRLKLGNLPIKPYTGTTVYSVDDSSGLITGHTETWDISALDAFVSCFVPGFGAPPAPPVS